MQNGEIYNFPELRRELEREGHTFRTHSDTEVHLHLYEQHGPDFARRLRGMFAVAIWDAHRQRLVLARDRYGIKPLYYRHVGGVLEFASELRALPRGEIDLDALEAFLAFNSIPAPYSIFREIRAATGTYFNLEESGAITSSATKAGRSCRVTRAPTTSRADRRAPRAPARPARALFPRSVGALLGGVDSAGLRTRSTETDDPRSRSVC